MTRARMTVLEHGAPAREWATGHRLGADDWIVVAQQSDEGALAFTQRVCRRVGRLCKEGAQLDSVDVFVGRDQSSAAARTELVDELSRQLVAGGKLTLWAGGRVADLAEFLAQDAQRDERSGVRHSAPLLLPPEPDAELEQSASA